MTIFALNISLAHMTKRPLPTPVIESFSINDDTDTLTIVRTGGGSNLVWATHLTTETLAADGFGGWTGTLLEQGAVSVPQTAVINYKTTITAATGPTGTARAVSVYVYNLADSPSNVQTDIFTVDITAPILSSVSASVVGTTATLSWSSDEGNGTAYWVCTTSPTTPNSVQIIAGEDQTDTVGVSSGVQIVSNTGIQVEQVVTGLVLGTTYFFHLVQQDASGNTSLGYSTTGVTVTSSGVSASINVVNRSVTGVAPEAFVFDLALSGFDATGPGNGEVYDPQLHDIYYYWDFGDSYEFLAPEKLIPQFRNSGIAYGPKVSHVYRSGGMYNVSCLIVEPSSGKTATVQLSVTVGDPDVLYAGTNTIYVDNTFDGFNVPPEAPPGAEVANDLEYAWNAVFSSAPNSPRRLMLARGQTHTPADLLPMGVIVQSPSVLVCAGPGAGAKPVIDTVNFGLTWGHTAGTPVDVDFKVQNIVWTGPWDTTTQSGAIQSLMLIYENRPKQLLFDGCEMRGFDIAVYPINPQVLSPDPQIIINDTVITNYRSACLFGDANWVITGSRLAQHVDALNGYAGVSNNLISCVRFPAAPSVICTQNDFFSRTGWFENTPGIYTSQACFRGNTAAFEGAFYNVNCNVMEGGVGTFSIDLDDTPTSYAINAIIEKNIIIGYHDSYRSMEFAFGGTTVRNNISIFPNVPRFGLPLFEFVAFQRFGSDTTNRDAPVQVYNNTFVCLVSTANVSGGPIPASVNSGGYTDYFEGNNISHQPNRGLIVTNLDTTVLWSPRYTHYKDDDTPRDNTKATPGDTVALYRPMLGSDALGDALADPTTYDDFFGNPRPQYPSRGALEVSS